MVVYIGKYKIQSDSNCWSVSRKKGKQWNALGYYNCFNKAVESLFDYKVRTETAEFVVNFNDATILESQKTVLMQRVESIKDEILEALK